MDLRQTQNKLVQRLMTTQIVQALMNEQLIAEQYKAYLQDVYCYALHSSQVIGIAGSRLVLSHPRLANYLFSHAGEELGHDTWAASDLMDLGVSENEIKNLSPSSPCARMIALEYFYAAHANPVGLFGWMFVLETLGGKVGGGIAKALDKTLKLNGKGLYFLSGHAEADSKHSEDLFAVISEGVTEEKDLVAFKCMVQESEDLYCAILDRAYATEGSTQIVTVQEESGSDLFRLIRASPG